MILGMWAVVWCGLTGCRERQPRFAPEANVATVTVAQPQRTRVTPYHEFAGWVEASQAVKLEAPVHGVLIDVEIYTGGEQRGFVEGSRVKQGELLFVIGQETSQSARLIDAEVAKKLAKTKLERARQYSREAEVAVAKAAYEAAETQAAEAKDRLKCCELRAPIDGLIGERLIDPGNLVGGAEETLLATLVATDPVHVYFPVDELAVRKLLAWKREHPGDGEGLKVEVGLVDEAGYPHEGRFDYLENRIDRTTGTALARATVSNPECRLYPGLSVRVRLAWTQPAEVLLVHEQAIGTDPGGKYLLILNDNHIPEQRYVQVGDMVDGMRVILNRYKATDKSGLEPSDRYIVDGLARAKPGRWVQVVSPDETAGDEDASKPQVRPSVEPKPEK